MAEESKFEQDLKAYFPEIYELHQLGKAESHVWELVDLLLKMRKEDATGIIYVGYSKGHIYEIESKVKVLADKGKRPGY